MPDPAQSPNDELELAPLDDEKNADALRESLPKRLERSEAIRLLKSLEQGGNATLEVWQASILDSAGLISFIDKETYLARIEEGKRLPPLEKRLRELGYFHDEGDPGRIQEAKAVIARLESDARDFFSSMGPLVSAAEQEEIERVEDQLERLRAEYNLLWPRYERMKEQQTVLSEYVLAGEVAVKLLPDWREAIRR